MTLRGLIAVRRLVRISTFLRGELVSTLRQSQVLLVLVVGPFLVLFAFGLGYERDLPQLATAVVGADDELADQVDSYIREAEPATIDYRGTTQDRDQALHRLREAQLDLVVVLPDRTTDVLAQSDRAVIEIHQRSLDPVTTSQIAVAAEAAVSDINDHVLEQVVRNAQERTDELASSLTAAREQLRALRSAFSEDDVATMQRVAADLADRVEQTADALARGGGFLGGTATRLSEAESSLRDAAQQLERLSEVNAVETIDEASTTLDELDTTVTLLRGLDPAVVVQPFEADVVRSTPVAITLDRFYAPGVIALMLQHVAVTFGALALVREREQGTVELFRVAPVSPGERLVGKGVAFVALGAVVAAVLTVLVVLAFGVPVPVDWGAYTALVLLTLVASLGYGYAIAGIAKTDTQAVQYAMLLLLAAIFFAGLLMPLDRIAAPARVVSWLLPATYAFTGLQELMLLGRRVTPELYVGLGVIAVVLLAASRVLVPRRDALV